MGCNCGGSKKALEQTGTLHTVDQGEGRSGWYWTGPTKGTPPPASPAATPSAPDSDQS